MPPFVPLRVMATVAHDEPLGAIVPGVNPRHKTTVSPASRHRQRIAPS